jgi:hypothetical protein
MGVGHVSRRKEQQMSVDVGDRIEVTSNVLGVSPRYGEVLAKSGGTGLRVRWDDGSETVFVPAGNTRVVAHDDSRGQVVELGCRVDITLTDADDECRAIASVETSQGRLISAANEHLSRPPSPQEHLVG